MYKTIRNIILVSALGVGGYFTAESLLSNEPAMEKIEEGPDIKSVFGQKYLLLGV